jgi:SAM-dependent methyltransferase
MTVPAAQLPEDPMAAARAYDQWFDGGWGRYAFDIEVAAIRNALGPLRGARILDAGCGTGRLLQHLGAAGARPTGLDVDAGMLEVAGERARVPLVRDDIRTLPFESGTFDAAVAITVLEYIDGVPRAISELCWVTRPGGSIVIGALNPRSAWGLAHRRRFRGPPWTRARFLTRRNLRRLGSMWERVNLRGVLFAPDHVPRAPLLGRAIEAAGRAVPCAGAVQILVIEPRG